MIESQLERKFVRSVKDAGGVTYKWVSPGTLGVPDRIVIYNGRVLFVELKTETGRLSPIQLYVHAILARNGAEVHIIRGEKQLDAFIESLTISASR
jgi:hypothetical protein